MLRLWKAFSRGFRSNIRNGTQFVEEESERLCSLVSNQPVSNFSIPIVKDDKFNKNDQRNQEAHRYWKHHEPYIFLEICGLSSMVALGWQYYHPDRKKENQINIQPNCLRALAKVALTQPIFQTKLGILPAKDNVKKDTNGNLQNDCDFPSSTPEFDNASTAADEVTKAMSQFAQDLDQGDKMLMAEWQNEAGVQLMSAARNGGCSQFDYLIQYGDPNQQISHKKEAFLCFRESMKLGSCRGAFNLGLCYEQGFGTKVNLEKASKCYEIAASKGHAGAQYNLGLLHYQKKLQNSDSLTGLKLLQQASSQGLQEARLALDTILRQTKLTSNLRYSASITSINGESRPNQIFRKIQSEPRILSTHHGEVQSATKGHKPAKFYLEGY